MARSNFEGDGAAHCKVWGRSAVSYANMAEPIEIPFLLWTRMDLWKHVLHGGAHCRNLANIMQCNRSL